MYIYSPNGQVIGLVPRNTSFPQVTLLDDFNRANNANLGSSWGAGIFSGNNYSISSNKALAGTEAENKWLDSQYTDFDIFFSMYFDESGFTEFDIIPRLIDSNTRLDIFVDNYSGASHWDASQKISGVNTSLKSSTLLPFQITSGDKFGLRLQGGIGTVYIYHDTQWHLVGTFTTTLLTAGYISIYASNDVTCSIDNFSVGTI